MKNWMKSRLARLGAPAALIASLAACGGETAEAGVLPASEASGAVVALEHDPGADRLLKAYANALYRSADGGAGWQPIPLPAAAGEGRVSAVAAADSGRVLYLAGPGMGVFRSTDAGKTWTFRGEGLPSKEVLAFAVHADRPATLYASLESGIYRSEDAGESWTQMDGGPGTEVRHFLHSDMEGSMQTGWLFAATPEGVRRSMDCFCGWRPTGEIPGGEITSVAYDPREPKRVYAATPAGLFRSEDGGEAWAAVAGAEQVRGPLAVDGAGAVYAADADGAVLKSADQGQGWTRIGA